jgi:DNA invertase Pin-like site-specific DNA recombinase
MLIGYARVSTDDQNTKLQLDALTRAGCKRIFEEKASGAKNDRPELARAIAIARDGDALVVWKLDRLGRSLPHLIATIKELAAAGIGFRSLTEAIDTTSSGGKLIFHIFGALAEFERDIIRDRTNAGLKAARAEGRLGGRRRDDRRRHQARKNAYEGCELDPQCHRRTHRRRAHDTLPRGQARRSASSADREGQDHTRLAITGSTTDAEEFSDCSQKAIAAQGQAARLIVVTCNHPTLGPQSSPILA